ncbi:3-isopropylmalate dehydratase small subunit [Kushneria phyllosphaerae]|uniref:3-isopropylmalate dehydratase small subunit n=1 Tax=Kushneria phyllosphaerae TaxID=2100822 RepID=A0A2R8CI52_9GAMM|nr:3-isopropylmalate dehydratase small subunit [Kushneria phyllosphaerae]SPJ32560.1 3-isopropylmalate dehydratase small subunit [Kushneria phyllosphaerae]
MEPFISVTGTAAPMLAANIDTDVIMPKQFLKGIDRQGLDRGLFHGLRFQEDGTPDPSFILNQPAWQGSRFLVVGPNFGCGSSREHAVWGLQQLGIRALIGTTFAGIFYDNCQRNGVLTIKLDPERHQQLADVISNPERNQITVDLEQQIIALENADAVPFQVDTLKRDALMRGLDAIGTTLERQAQIMAFEQRHLAQNPWLK